MQIRQKVEHRLRNALNVNVNVELVEPGSLPRFEGKAKRVVDTRLL
jgi:phenylacetate-CoA ligase